MIRWLWATFAFLALSGPAAAAAPTPLFASDDMIRITITGSLRALSGERGRQSGAQAGSLALAGAAPETHAIRLSARGLTRRQRDICQFPPLRVEFAQPPAAGSLFAGQRRLKLVTHCRDSASFQKHVLTEYAAYRLYNRLTPMSYRVRLAAIDYVDENGRSLGTRPGFFIEDVDDVAARNGAREAGVGDRIAPSRLEPEAGGRLAMFQYMIGNLDWSMIAGPEGDGCCHNSRLIAPAGGTALVPVPYDFDFSGLVDAPYAVPPDAIRVSSVRVRRYQGFCRHNAEARSFAVDLRGRRGEIEAEIGAVPGLDRRAAASAIAYLGGFFDRIATDQGIEEVLRSCA